MKMPEYNQNSGSVTTFQAFTALEDGATLAGYSALIEVHGLSVDQKDR